MTSPAAMPGCPAAALTDGTRLAAFARGDAGNRCPSGSWTGMVLNELSGPDRSCVDATDDELIGLLGRRRADLLAWALAARIPRIGAALEADVGGPTGMAAGRPSH